MILRAVSRFRWWLLASLICVAMPSRAEVQGFPETPSLSVIVSPEEADWWVEGQILVVVRLVSRHPFEALSLPLEMPEGVRTIELMRPRTREERSYAGNGWVHETRIAVFPLSPGPLTIPALHATGAVAGGTDGPVPFDLRSEPISKEVRSAPAGYDDPVWRVSTGITLSEKWSKPPDTARHGEILRRVVTASAAGMTGAQIRLPEMRRTLDMAQADLETTTRTETSGSGIIGYATRSWSVEIGEADVVYLAPVGLSYWDPVRAEMRRAAVPGYRVEPAPADAKAIAAQLMREAEMTRKNSAVLLGLMLTPIAALFILLGLPWGMAWLPGRADLSLRRALARQATPRQALLALETWRRAQSRQPDALPDALRQAEARLLDPVWHAEKAPDLVRDLRRAARKATLHRLRERNRRLLVTLIGPPGGLASLRHPAEESCANAGQAKPTSINVQVHRSEIRRRS